jgi:hypothetical protein
VRWPRLRLGVSRVPWRRITAGRALPWVLAAVFLGTSLANWWLLRSDHHDDARRSVVTSTATSFLSAFTNYRAGSITQDVATIEGYAIGTFATQLRQTFDTAAIDRIKANNVTATGRTWNLALHDLSDGTAHVRAIVYETVAKTGAATMTDVFQLDVEFVRSGNAWKVDQVNANILSPGTSTPGA